MTITTWPPPGLKPRPRRPVPPPVDLSHLTDEQFLALCPQGLHGVGVEEVQPPPEEEQLAAIASELARTGLV